MSLVKNTYDHYSKFAGENFNTEVMNNWLRVRGIEVKTLGSIHPETGTFFTDDFGMSIDWDNGRVGINCEPDGRVVAVVENAFGNTEYDLTSDFEIEAFFSTNFGPVVQ